MFKNFCKRLGAAVAGLFCAVATVILGVLALAAFAFELARGGAAAGNPIAQLCERAAVKTEELFSYAWHGDQQLALQQ